MTLFALGNLARDIIVGAVNIPKGGRAVNESDHFIDEVTEELRRDTMFATLRKAAPYIALGVVAIVGVASYIQYRDYTFQKQSETFGSALQTYFKDNTSVELAPAAATDSQKAVVAFLNDAPSESGNPSFDTLSAFQNALILEDQTERGAALTEIANGAGAFALLAQEQLAILGIETGDLSNAEAQLTALLEAPNATQDLKFRAQQLLEAIASGVFSAQS